MGAVVGGTAVAGTRIGSTPQASAATEPIRCDSGKTQESPPGHFAFKLFFSGEASIIGKEVLHIQLLDLVVRRP